MNFCGVRKLDDLTKIHHSNAVADMFYKIESVGNEEVGQVELFLQLFEKVDDLCLNRNVERRYRLVANQKGRFYRERAGYPDSLALTARKLVRLTGGKFRTQPDQLQELADPLPNRRPVGA